MRHPEQQTQISIQAQISTNISLLFHSTGGDHHNLSISLEIQEHQGNTKVNGIKLPGKIETFMSCA